VAREAPEAWFINFTNPVGVMSGVVRDVLGHRVMGVCDTPVALCRRVAALLARNPAELSFDYFGLNHLGWLQSVRDSGSHDHHNLLPELLADDAALGELIEGRLFGAEFLRHLRMLPSEYLAYYYFPLRQVQAVASAGQSRAEYLLAQQQRFYTARHPAADDPLHAWRAIHTERERSYMAEAHATPTIPRGARGSHVPADDHGDGYAGVAVAVLESLATDAHTNAIINLANQRSLAFLEDDAIVELPCRISAGGAVACTAADVPEQCRTLMQRVHAAEQAAVRASRTTSRNAAIEALALHPLVESTELAERIFNDYLRQQPALAAQFA
jgi:6-phospho-beta-glucosidase